MRDELHWGEDEITERTLRPEQESQRFLRIGSAANQRSVAIDGYSILGVQRDQCLGIAMVPSCNPLFEKCRGSLLSIWRQVELVCSVMVGTISGSSAPR